MSLTTVQSGIGGTGNPSLTFPSGTGTVAVQGLSTNIVSGTPQNTTSGTSITFTGIPSWAKRITVMLNGVSTNGSSLPQIQIGSGSVTTSGYASSTQNFYANGAFQLLYYTSGFVIADSSASDARTGTLTLTLFSANNWIAVGSFTTSSSGSSNYVQGLSPALSGPLDRIVLTTVNGTDTFDAGSINILYE